MLELILAILESKQYANIVCYSTKVIVLTCKVQALAIEESSASRVLHFEVKTTYMACD